MKPTPKALTEIQLSFHWWLWTDPLSTGLGWSVTKCCENVTPWFGVFLRTVPKSMSGVASPYIVLQNCPTAILLTIWKPLVSFSQQ